MELVTAMWRQDRLRGLELATLAAAESPLSEATVKKLGTYARYGARIEKDIGSALQALRALRKRPDEWIDELPDSTSEPSEARTPTRKFTNELSPCTFEPERPEPQEANGTVELTARTPEPEPVNANEPLCAAEPEPPALNRRQRRALAALARRRRAA